MVLVEEPFGDLRQPTPLKGQLAPGPTVFTGVQKLLEGGESQSVQSTQLVSLGVVYRLLGSLTSLAKGMMETFTSPAFAATVCKVASKLWVAVLSAEILLVCCTVLSVSLIEPVLSRTSATHNLV